MMGWSPRCFTHSFVEIGLLVPEKIFEGFFTIYGQGGHLGHVTSIILIYIFISMYLQVYIQNLVKYCQVVSEKSMF